MTPTAVHWTNQSRPGVVGVELEGNLRGNQEQEVTLNVSHRLLHHGLLRDRTPVSRVNAVGRVDGGAPLLFGQTGQETPHLRPEEDHQNVSELSTHYFTSQTLAPLPS